jgi:hypothetical protein
LHDFGSNNLVLLWVRQSGMILGINLAWFWVRQSGMIMGKTIWHDFGSNNFAWFWVRQFGIFIGKTIWYDYGYQFGMIYGKATMGMILG